MRKLILTVFLCVLSSGCGSMNNYVHQLSEGVSFPVTGHEYHEILGKKLICKVPIQVVKNSDENLTYAIPIGDSKERPFDFWYSHITTLPVNSVFTVVHVTRRYGLNYHYNGEPVSGADVIIAHVDSPNYHKDVVLKVLKGAEKGNLSAWFDPMVYQLK